MSTGKYDVNGYNLEFVRNLNEERVIEVMREKLAATLPEQLDRGHRA